MFKKPSKLEKDANLFFYLASEEQLTQLIRYCTNIALEKAPAFIKEVKEIGLAVAADSANAKAREIFWDKCYINTMTLQRLVSSTSFTKECEKSKQETLLKASRALFYMATVRLPNTHNNIKQNFIKMVVYTPETPELLLQKIQDIHSDLKV